MQNDNYLKSYNSSKTRDLYWDTLKFILIFLVIYGHIIEGYKTIESFNNAVWNLIYLFHMPLFIFVSGRFSHIHNINKYWAGIIHIFETYLVFQVLYTILDGELTWTTITRPYFHLWYLLSLIWWRIMVIITTFTIKNKNPKIIISLSIIISLLSGFIPISNDLSFQRTFSFLPFFVLGYYSVNFELIKYLKIIPITLAFGSISILFGSLYYAKYDLGAILWGSVPYWNGNWNLFKYTFIGLVYRFILGGAAIFISTIIMRIVNQNIIFGKMGKKTLFLFAYHVFLLILLNKLVILNVLKLNLILLFLYAVLTTILLLLISRIKLFNILLNPFSHFLRIWLH